MPCPLSFPHKIAPSPQPEGSNIIIKHVRGSLTAEASVVVSNAPDTHGLLGRIDTFTTALALIGHVGGVENICLQLHAFYVTVGIRVNAVFYLPLVN